MFCPVLAALDWLRLPESGQHSLGRYVLSPEGIHGCVPPACTPLSIRPLLPHPLQTLRNRTLADRDPARTVKSRRVRRAELQDRIFYNRQWWDYVDNEDKHRRMNAVLELILDTLEPDPKDRPSARELLEYPIFSLPEGEKVVKARPSGFAQVPPRKRRGGSQPSRLRMMKQGPVTPRRAKP